MLFPACQIQPTICILMALHPIIHFRLSHAQSKSPIRQTAMSYDGRWLEHTVFLKKILGALGALLISHSLFVMCVFQPIKKMAIYTWYKVNGREKCSGNTQTQLCPLLMCYDVIINAKQTHLLQITYFFFAAAPFSAVVRMEQYGAGMLYRLKKSTQMGLSDPHFVVLVLG